MAWYLVKHMDNFIFTQLYQKEMQFCKMHCWIIQVVTHREPSQGYSSCMSLTLADLHSGVIWC
jgi:hypothetical protein